MMGTRKRQARKSGKGNFRPGKIKGDRKAPGKILGDGKGAGKIEKGRKAPGPEKFWGTERARPEKSDREKAPTAARQKSRGRERARPDAEKAPTVRRRRPEMIPAELARSRRRSRRPPALIPDAFQINHARRRSCRRSAGSNASRSGDRPHRAPDAAGTHDRRQLRPG